MLFELELLQDEYTAYGFLRFFRVLRRSFSSRYIEIGEGSDPKYAPRKIETSVRKTFANLSDWMDKKNVTLFDETVLFAYFNELKKKQDWTRNFVVEMVNDQNDVVFRKKNIDIRPYQNLNGFVKRCNVGAFVKKAKVITSAEIKRFLDEAPHEQYLITKVCAIYYYNIF